MSGGNLSQAITGTLGSANLNARNQMAIADSGIRRQNLLTQYGLAGQLQGVDNLRSSQEMARRGQEEQALGGALQAGLNNIVSPFNQKIAMDFYGKQIAGTGGADVGQTFNNMFGGFNFQSPTNQNMGGIGTQLQGTPQQLDMFGNIFDPTTNMMFNPNIRFNQPKLQVPSLMNAYGQ